MEHTIGEWKITTEAEHLKDFLKSLKPKDLYSILYSEKKGEIAIILAGIIRRYERKEKDQAQANAYLIKAAPKLLESHNINVIEAKAALKARKLYKHGTDISPIINGFIECLQRIVKRSEQAIAKAEKEMKDG